jgi:hypothetical protein
MNTDNTTSRLVQEGIRAEFEGRIDDARALYLQAWETSTNDYNACVAAHYIARYQSNPEDTLRWNQEALARADAVGDDRVQTFYPSLYVNLGHAYEMLGHQSEAQRYYKLAADLGLTHRIEGEPPLPTNSKSQIENSK